MSLLKKKYELVNPDEKPIDTDVYFRAAPHNLARAFGQRFCLIRKL